MKQIFTYLSVCLLGILLVIGSKGFSQSVTSNPNYKPSESKSNIEQSSNNEVVTPVHPVEREVKENSNTTAEPEFPSSGPEKQKNESSQSGSLRLTANNHLSSSGDNHLNLNIGNLGIGTDMPLQKLHVNGIGQFDLGTGSVSLSTPGGWPGVIAFENPTGYRRDIIFDGVGMRLLAHDNSSPPPNTNGIVINNMGNVGIGTEPAWPLHIVSDQIDDELRLEGTDYPFLSINGLFTDGNTGIELMEFGVTKAYMYYLGAAQEIRITRPGLNDFIIESNGNIGIGVDDAVEKLTVDGRIKAREIWCTLTSWPDYVFDEDYQLQPLAELDQYIKKNKHLPDIPTEKEILENGLMLAEMESIIMKKIEELTLYVIEQQKEIELLKAQNEELKSLIDKED